MRIVATSPNMVHVWEDLPDTNEMMWYQYLPVLFPENITGMPGLTGLTLEPRLYPFKSLIKAAYDSLYGWRTLNYLSADPKDYYIYLTAKIGYATPENPLNRPGWHIDAWGHPEDHNFVWSDVFPTRYIEDVLEDVPTDDSGALAVFERYGRKHEDTGTVLEVEPNQLYYFHSSCVHATPIIEKSGMRKFVKITFSPHKYNLEGNSHNYLIPYKWKMYSRADIRNDPVAGNGDFRHD